MMRMKLLAPCLVVALVAGGTPVRAENRMGYELLSPDAAAALPRNHGSLGLQIARMQQITDGGMTFDIIRVTQVRRGSPGAQAGLVAGDQIIAVDGHVFPTLATFAAYVGSVQPGRTASVDYMPANGGPAQAQRVAVVVGAAGAAPITPAAPQGTAAGGMSAGEKLAIGAGAAALLGCYEMGCFSHREATNPAISGNQQQGAPPTYR